MGEELLTYFPIMAAKKILARFDSILRREHHQSWR